ncbi:RHS repeat-associated core domain-containing protein [Pseudomonas sp. NFX224]|uniref:RHS repeat-associated core domain-containing protein n=1 Tax=Pseudomonas sp. NFX224 TaxID=3402862 RepID=UPI003AFA3DA4
MNATLLCRYRYDPLDRLVQAQPTLLSNNQIFYNKSRVATLVQDKVQCSIFQHDLFLLAQKQRDCGITCSTLLATDLQRSVLHSLRPTDRQAFAYSPYGHRTPEGGLLSLVGFNGEWPDPVTGHYFLGNGYRAFNPVLKRFNSPDSLSPFGKGGMNTYAYCAGDPINRVDPNGRAWSTVIRLMKSGAFRDAARTARTNGTPTQVQTFSGPTRKELKSLRLQITEVMGPPKIRWIPDSNKVVKVNKFDKVTGVAKVVNKEVTPQEISLEQAVQNKVIAKLELSLFDGKSSPHLKEMLNAVIERAEARIRGPELSDIRQP